MSGRIAEYANITNGPIIITTDKRQNVMVIMVGTDDWRLDGVLEAV